MSCCSGCLLQRFAMRSWIHGGAVGCSTGTAWIMSALNTIRVDVIWVTTTFSITIAKCWRHMTGQRMPSTGIFTLCRPIVTRIVARPRSRTHRSFTRYCPVESSREIGFQPCFVPVFRQSGLIVTGSWSNGYLSIFQTWPLMTRRNTTGRLISATAAPGIGGRLPQTGRCTNLATITIKFPGTVDD